MLTWTRSTNSRTSQNFIFSDCRSYILQLECKSTYRFIYIQQSTKILHQYLLTFWLFSKRISKPRKFRRTSEFTNSHSYILLRNIKIIHMISEIYYHDMKRFLLYLKRIETYSQNWFSQSSGSGSGLQLNGAKALSINCWLVSVPFWKYSIPSRMGTIQTSGNFMISSKNIL